MLTLNKIKKSNSFDEFDISDVYWLQNIKEKLKLSTDEEPFTIIDILDNFGFEEAISYCEYLEEDFQEVAQFCIECSKKIYEISKKAGGNVISHIPLDCRFDSFWVGKKIEAECFAKKTAEKALEIKLREICAEFQ